MTELLNLDGDLVITASRDRKAKLWSAKYANAPSRPRARAHGKGGGREGFNLTK